ncbi:hypothetical protein ZIOFF_014432 [Zingiber officinale]|uniref:IAA-alanine resistance protein 1 n=1 Tax=Zingiber officinale TaxID=94328 RepID=A0A8J5LPH5_ZINOF|nr:hypothetical protein ZIOFF_014432 [Zingiber officinale]
MGCSLLVSLASLICLILLPVIFLKGKPSKAVVDSLAIFGAGAMLGDAFLHQLPHAFVGIVLFFLVEKVVRYVEDNSDQGDHDLIHGHHHHHKRHNKLKDEDHEVLNGDNQEGKTEKESSHSESDDTPAKGHSDHDNLLRKRVNTSSGTAVDGKDSKARNSSASQQSSTSETASQSSLVFGYLNLFSDGVHNFTDGMALGSAFLLHGSVGGWSRTLFLLAHELPQEVGDFGILVRSGFSVPKALFFNFLSALVALAGTALALFLGKDPGQSSLIEGFTAGGFIYIAVAGVLPQMNDAKTTFGSTAVQLTSLVVGMSVALCISLFE